MPAIYHAPEGFVRRSKWGKSSLRHHFVMLVFFYYFAFILLLGAEVNSWASGQRQTASDLASIIYETHEHNTTPGAAGPTSGLPTEAIQSHEWAEAMKTGHDSDHA